MITSIFKRKSFITGTYMSLVVMPASGIFAQAPGTLDPSFSALEL
jgi:hypothetical protein